MDKGAWHATVHEVAKESDMIYWPNTRIMYIHTHTKHVHQCVCSLYPYNYFSFMIAAVDKKLIYSQSKREMENFLWVHMSVRSVYMWLWWRGTCKQGHILVESDYSLGGASILVQSFSAFLSMRRCKKLGSQDFLLQISNYLKANSAIFPRMQSVSSWSLL